MDEVGEITMDKRQQFRTEFLTLCDKYEIDAADISTDFINEVFEKAIPLGAVVMPNEVVGGGQWQKCPKCDGQGIVSKPPWINGDQETWTASEGSYTCNLCNGQMVIKQRCETCGVDGHL